MKLIFLGTRGDIEEYNKKHKKHSSLLIKYKNKKLLIDFGKNHDIKELNKIKPNYILITHAHKDHCYGLKQGTKIPVYLEKQTLSKIKKFPINAMIIKPNKYFKLNNIKILPYRVTHSKKVSTLGFKIFINNKKIIYNPDLIEIKNKKILSNIDLYIGDGASLYRNIMRKKGKTIIGHISIKNQIEWCKKYKIKKATFTHFGKQIIEMNEKKLREKIKKLTEDKIKIILACDNMTISLS